jgi:protein AbiQ
MKFIHVDTEYLKVLHDACEEVRYKQSGYESKPFVGVLITNGDRKYVIPLSSAKPKHRTWKNVDKDIYLIYEYVEKSNMSHKDITRV